MNDICKRPYCHNKAFPGNDLCFDCIELGVIAAGCGHRPFEAETPADQSLTNSLESERLKNNGGHVNVKAVTE